MNFGETLFNSLQKPKRIKLGISGKRDNGKQTHGETLKINHEILGVL